MGFFGTIFVGIIAGWLAEKVMHLDMSIWKNLALGLCGSVLGSIVLGIIGADKPAGMISGIVVAFLGSCLIVWLSKTINGKKKN